MDRKGIRVVLLVLLFVGLTVIVTLTAFLLGRQSGIISPGAPTPATFISPTPAAAIAQTPLIFVTNTPTVTPRPTATAGPTATPSPTYTPTPTPTDTPTPTPTPIVVITHINALGRLETAEFVMQTVVDLENEPGNFWEELVGSDKLMLVAEGEVVAGFDLSKVSEADIVVQGTTVNITLPAPEVLYSRIDNERTYVYGRETGFLVSPDPSLEARARQTAEQALTHWALERGIIQKAEDYGRIQLENLLRSLGFTNIIINVEESDL